VMPLERITVRLIARVVRHADAKTCGFSLVELGTVPSIRPQFRTNPESEIRVDSDIATVVESVNVGTQEECIWNGMRSSLAGEVPDVGCLETRVGAAARDRAAIFICLVHGM